MAEPHVGVRDLPETLVMGRDDHESARAPQAVDHPENVVDLVGIEMRRGLVGQEQRWPADKGPGERHSLLLTSGKTAWPASRLAGQADLVEQLERLLPRGPGADTRQQQRGHHVLHRREAGHEVEGLEHDADRVSAMFQEGPPGHPGEFPPRKADGAGVGREQPCQYREKSRLATPTGSHHHHDLSVARGEGEVLQRVDNLVLVGVGHRQRLDGEVSQHGRHGLRPFTRVSSQDDSLRASRHVTAAGARIAIRLGAHESEPWESCSGSCACACAPVAGRSHRPDPRARPAPHTRAIAHFGRQPAGQLVGGGTRRAPTRRPQSLGESPGRPTSTPHPAAPGGLRVAVSRGTTRCGQCSPTRALSATTSAI